MFVNQTPVLNYILVHSGTLMTLATDEVKKSARREMGCGDFYSLAVTAHCLTEPPNTTPLLL